jgi:hypothetical protein
MDFMNLIHEYDGELSSLVSEWQAKFADNKKFEGSK